ncbi:MAG: SigE family RNA polymerase sigma factor [Actinomycetota bacterium]|nr:SigE family RNA polymerase sigma factor [Actinomycetota bacterium]
MADRSDYPVFVAARWTRLLRVAYLLVQDWAGAEDLTQAALVKAWLAWPRLDGDPEAYVRKIIVTTYVSWGRRRWRRSEAPTAQLPEQPGRGRDMEQVDDRDALWRALGRLPARQRAVVVLRFFEDLTEAQVAALLGCSVGTVKSQTSRALAKLRVDDTLLSAPTER